MTELTTDHVEINGLDIAFRRKGEGPPIVLLHGFVGDGREWGPVMDELSDRFAVVAWDAPGSGRSSDPPASFRMPDFADCLAGFIGAIGLGRPHVIGLSFGGTLALELYRRHPELPRTLILAGAYAGWAGSLGAEGRDQRLARTLEFAALPPRQFVEAMLPSMMSASAAEDRQAELAAIMAELHPSGFLTMAHAVAEADLRDVLPRIEVPTLVLHGERDARASLAVAEDLHAAIPGSKMVVMPGLGHMSSFEAPEQFSAQVRSFLQEQPG